MISVECPSCSSFLEIDPSKDNVECPFCGRKYSFAQLSRPRVKRTIDTTNIYNTKGYEEVLTVSNLTTLKYDALVERIYLAHEVKQYERVKVYANELFRRNPRDPIVYEYRLLAKYRCASIEELANLETPVYKEEDFRLLYEFCDDIVRVRLEAVKAKITAKLEEKERQKQLEREENRKKAIPYVVLSCVLLALSIFTGILTFANFKRHLVIGTPLTIIGFLWFVCLMIGIGVASIVIRRFVRDGEANKSSRTLAIVSSVIAGIMLIVDIVGIAKDKLLTPFNPGNEIGMTVTGADDSYTGYKYVTTFNFIITNNSDYNITRIDGNINIYVNGVSQASGSCWFSGGFNAGTTTNNDLRIELSNSNVYNASFDQMRITFKVSKLQFEKYYDSISFKCKEIVCH